VTDDRGAQDALRPRGRRSVLFAALLLVLLASVDLFALLVWAPTPQLLWQEAVRRLLFELWPLLMIASFLVTTYEVYLHRRLVAEIARIAGPGIVETLLPQEVMETFLDFTYGKNEANRDVVVGVLGGEGLRPRGGDLTISTHTTVDYELRAVDFETYHLTSTVSYSFKKNVAVDQFIIFATCNALLRDSIASGSRLPLFELWFVPDASLFQDSVDDMLPSAQIGIDYIDHRGQRRVAESSRIRLQEVKYDQWAEYLTFFRESMGSMPRQNTRNHLSDLRIFECDLSGIADDDHVVSAIERLTLRSTTRQRVDDGYCYWQAPYPCYVERITFDAKQLAVDDLPAWEFRIVPFTFRSNTSSARWLSAEEVTDLDVRSWLLPGHGVALLWREQDFGF
jgi:hypothetical protein